MTKNNEEVITKDEVIETITKAFEESLIAVKYGRNFIKNKNQYYNEVALYALQMKKLFNRNDLIKKLLIDSRMLFFKAYFEDLGLFYKYNAKEDFLKVFTDEEGFFNTFEVSNGWENFKKYSDYLKEAKEEKKKTQIIDFEKRLNTLFKDESKESIMVELESFCIQKGIKASFEEKQKQKRNK